ncbi:hypothetical protein IEQ34_021282 [Dendrobium chrysotoxum]|uniref:Uncharacterized protein n=1 Tax=Dendrobium chrysotoxum TaxID=161865 RepID=A0AAV7G4A9_DENCH|nr:hypothetical protein IEQ34_021282 [Dendrobium chrysotoxum]
MYARSAIWMNNCQSDPQSRENRKGGLQQMVKSSSFRATSFRLINMPKVKCLESKFNVIDQYNTFPLLELLYIMELEALEDWFGAGVAAEDGWLEDSIYRVEDFICCSISNSISLEFLVVYYYPNITSLLPADEIARLGALRYLKIKRCPNLISLGRHRDMDSIKKLLSHAKKLIRPSIKEYRGAPADTRMGPDEHVIGTHVTSMDVTRVNKFESDPPKQMDLQNTSFTVQLGRGTSIQLANAIINTRNAGATIQFSSVDFSAITARIAVVPANDVNSERLARRLHLTRALTRRTHLPVLRPTTEFATRRMHLLASRTTTAAENPCKRTSVFEKLSQPEALAIKRVVAGERISMVTANITSLSIGLPAPRRNDSEASRKAYEKAKKEEER